MDVESPAVRQGGRTAAVVLAGGAGTRMGLDLPKQLIRVAGKPIIAHTLSTLDAASEIDDIVVVMTPGHLGDVRDIVRDEGVEKVRAVLPGGATRTQSTRIALDHLGDDTANVLFHDAVRPLLSQRIIRECCNALRRYQAVDVAIPSADTIVVVQDGVIESIPDRTRIRRGQTPQGFHLATIREAYRLAAQDPTFAATDDCGVVRRYLPHVPIKVVDGDEENIKITHPVDVHIADKLFQLAATHRHAVRSARAYGEHLRGRTVVVLGGGSGIGLEVHQLAERFGADVFSFSPSTTGTYAQSADDVRAALEQAWSATGRVDAVVVTAGLLHRGPLADTDEATIDAVIGANYLAPVTTARLSLEYLRATRGHLLFFTSSSYTRGRAGFALYSSMKAAVVNLTQALADEWSAYGVRVNCVNPERTASRMRTRAFGLEPPDSLLSCEDVALISLDVLTSDLTGQVVDVRLFNMDSNDGEGVLAARPALQVVRS
jgi:ribitol-5-phosphate 2-dehydrogenase (NADP+) / D-ribitol-5-phosphate cytidylyltransferase